MLSTQTNFRVMSSRWIVCSLNLIRVLYLTLCSLKPRGMTLNWNLTCSMPWGVPIIWNMSSNWNLRVLRGNNLYFAKINDSQVYFDISRFKRLGQLRWLAPRIPYPKAGGGVRLENKYYEVILRTLLENQVWSLTQFYSVDFSQSRISVNKCVFSKRTIKVCISCF